MLSVTGMCADALVATTMKILSGGPLRTLMGEEARARVQTFRIERFVGEIREVYNEVVSTKMK